MNNVLKKFNKLKINKSLIGLEKGDSKGGYYCTPVGAKVFGWLGVDGVHFCTVKGFGDVIFAVSPSPCGENEVNVIAENFETFFSLVFACNHANPLEWVSYMDKDKFYECLKEEEKFISIEQQNVLSVIAKELELSKVKEPYEYIKDLQSWFDISKLKFTDEYYEFTGKDRADGGETIVQGFDFGSEEVRFVNNKE